VEKSSNPLKHGPSVTSHKGRLTTHSTTGMKYVINSDILYCEGDKEGQNWKAVLLECLEQKVMKFVHTSLGHLRSDKCYAEIKDTFYFRNLGRKLRKFITACDLCQQAKHMNRAYDVAERHLPKRPGEMCAFNLFGSLPTLWGNVRYIFICYDRFSKYVKSATTKACLNKLLNHYFFPVIKPKLVLSDKGSQFRSPVWLKKLKENYVTTRFHPLSIQRATPVKEL
jgi:hypothetical protein